jgi:ssDNA-binding Zn-finger/Zn-ribbon topoisomerase 1
MPGINLVAYFVQTLDEVETGRKEARNAVLQLDQMLRRHGAAPFRKSKAERENRAASPERPRLRRPARLKAPSRQELEALRHDPAALGEPAPENTPIPEAEAVPEAQAVPEAEALPEPPAPTGMPEGEPAAGFHEGEEGGLDQAAVCGNPEEEESAAETSPQEAESVLPDPEHSPTIAPDETVPEAPPWGTVEGTVQDPLEEAKPVSDPEAQVEDQVSAFEERLAMQCPVCRKASVEVRETAKGRVFYQCADEECMFISWGRPHHIPCPLCGNPFLVERDVAGDPKPLKCPRATCRYRETASGEAQKTGEVGTGEPKPRRRVVRRKVRRRKR